MSSVPNIINYFKIFNNIKIINAVSKLKITATNSVMSFISCFGFLDGRQHKRTKSSSMIFSNYTVSVCPPFFLSLYLSFIVWSLTSREVDLLSSEKMSMSMPMPMPMPMPTPPDSNDMNDMVMHMSLFWGKDVIVLFQGWPGNSLGMYILATIFVLFMAFLVELLSISPSFRPGRSWSPLITSLIHAGAYALRMALAYMLMLSLMTFNIGIFIAAVAGHTLGRFFVKYRSFIVASPASPKLWIF